MHDLLPSSNLELTMNKTHICKEEVQCLNLSRAKKKKKWGEWGEKRSLAQCHLKWVLKAA